MFIVNKKLLLALIPCVLASCAKDDVSTITIVTSVDRVEYTKAVVSATVKTGEAPVTIQGVEIFYTNTFTNATNSRKMSADGNKYSAELGSLEDGAKYEFHVRVNVRNNSTGDDIGNGEFITFPEGPIDLDLPSGKKWASHNIGASIPTDVGDYYAWGETSAKNQYDWTTYKYAKGAYDKLTKYISRTYESWDKSVDNKMSLDSEDDAAYVKTGGLYYTPSYDDWKELIENASYKTETINGIRGIKVYSKSDPDNPKKFIFFSAEGGDIRGFEWTKSNGKYWTSTRGYSASEANAYVLYNSLGTSFSSIQPYRCYGLPVRGVCD